MRNIATVFNRVGGKINNIDATLSVKEAIESLSIVEQKVKDCMTEGKIEI